MGDFWILSSFISIFWALPTVTPLDFTLFAKGIQTFVHFYNVNSFFISRQDKSILLNLCGIVRMIPSIFSQNLQVGSSSLLIVLHSVCWYSVKCIVVTKIFWCVLYNELCPTEHFLFWVCHNHDLSKPCFVTTITWLRLSKYSPVCGGIP